MTIVNLTKLKREDQEKIKQNIESHFKIKNFQTYFPAMIFWEDFDNNSYSKQLFILDSKYKLESLERKSEKNDSDLDYLGYITKNDKKKNKKSKNDDNKHNNTKHEIHFKINPLLEPTNVMMNKYKLESTNLMPNVFDYITNKKINSPHNFSYVETLFVYLSSGLVEKGKCPSFTYFYGSYLGIMENFKQNISDDYDTMKKCSWFKENNDKLFKIEKVSIEDELLKSIPDLPLIDPEEQKNKDTIIGAEEFDFDSIDINTTINMQKKRQNSFNTSDNEDDKTITGEEDDEEENDEEVEVEEDEEDEEKDDEKDEEKDEEDEEDDEEDEEEDENEEEEVEVEKENEEEDDDEEWETEDEEEIDLDNDECKIIKKKNVKGKKEIMKKKNKLRMDNEDEEEEEEEEDDEEEEEEEEEDEEDEEDDEEEEDEEDNSPKDKYSLSYKSYQEELTN